MTYMVGESEGAAARAASFSEEAIDGATEDVKCELRTASRRVLFRWLSFSIATITITSTHDLDLLRCVSLPTVAHTDPLSRPRGCCHVA